jgi:hypothetical protein
VNGEVPRAFLAWVVSTLIGGAAACAFWALVGTGTVAILVGMILGLGVMWLGDLVLA